MPPDVSWEKLGNLISFSILYSSFFEAVRRDEDDGGFFILFFSLPLSLSASSSSLQGWNTCTVQVTNPCYGVLLCDISDTSPLATHTHYPLFFTQNKYTRAMGASQSSPEDILKVAAEPANYSPPLQVNPANPLVYFDVQLGRYGNATPLGRIVMELKEDTTPKTVSDECRVAREKRGCRIPVRASSSSML